MNSAYRPIPCQTYAEFELAILQGRSLRMLWRAPCGETRLETVRPLDLRTRRGSEYMILRNSAGHRRIARLDRIRRAVPILVHRRGDGR